MVAVPVILALSLLTASKPAAANCIRQSLMKHDYCGPEGNRLGSAVVLERAIGNFKGACAAHDACYTFGANNIVRQMEQKYGRSMTSASKNELAEFKSQASTIKRQCDRTFLTDLNAACTNVNIVVRGKCGTMARTYYVGVAALAGGAMDRAITNAFNCRLN